MIIENKKWKLEIEPCEGCNPREDDNITNMVCFNKSYNLGDKHEYNFYDYSNWDEMKAAIIKKEDVAIIKPMFMYDHSGITIATTPFSCRFDSGQIGFVFITKEYIRENYGIKRISQQYIDKAEAMVEGEMKTYDQYLSGDVYSYTVTNKETEEEDSCAGFYGSNIFHNGMIDYIGVEVIESLKEELNTNTQLCTN